MKNKHENHNGLEQTVKSPSPERENSDLPPGAPQTGPDCVNRKSKIVNSTRRSTGKVSRLPRHVRLEVSFMLEDGLTYNQIIAKLDELGYPGFFYQNIQRWRLGVGHQAFLRQQERCQAAVTAKLIQSSRAAWPAISEGTHTPHLANPQSEIASAI